MAGLKLTFSLYSNVAKYMKYCHKVSALKFKLVSMHN